MTAHVRAKGEKASSLHCANSNSVMKITADIIYEYKVEEMQGTFANAPTKKDQIHERIIFSKIQNILEIPSLKM